MLAYQILKAGYYWPYIFKDAHNHAKTCHVFHTATGREKNSSLPLHPVLESRPFAKWALDFIGVVHPNSSTGHQFILTTTDYCMRWTKAQAYRNATTEVVVKFLELIVTRFGMLYSLVCDNGPPFASIAFSEWAYDHDIMLGFSSNYYPQGNGVVESTNKNPMTVIKKLLDKNPRDWHNKLKYALWFDRIRVKKSIGTSPVRLVYDIEPVFPVHLKINTLQFMKEYLDTDDVVETRLVQLLKLEEERE